MYVCMYVRMYVTLYVCMYACMDKRLIDCGDLKTEVRVCFIVMATLWGSKAKH